MEREFRDFESNRGHVAPGYTVPKGMRNGGRKGLNSVIREFGPGNIELADLQKGYDM